MKESGCYNCPVKGCTAAYRGSQCSVLREIAGVNFDPMTNADRIRAMSDEELADQLVIKIEEIAPLDMFLSPPIGRMFISRKEAVHVTLEWLRLPEKEN